MPALLPVILAASHIALVVDAVPKFNVEQTCRRAGEVSASLGYLELPTCLEMAKQAKELPEAWKMGASGQRLRSGFLAGRRAEGTAGRALHLCQFVGGELLRFVLVGLRFLLFLRGTHLTFRHDDLPEVKRWRILAGAPGRARGGTSAVRSLARQRPPP
jgi:hypothetical protein